MWRPTYAAIHMPRNSPTGVVTAFFATVMGFALIWHIWWLLGVGFVGAYATFVVFAWRDGSDEEIPAKTVARIDRPHRDSQATPQGAADLTAAHPSSATHGHGSAAPAPLGGIASKRIIVGYGFWIFLLFGHYPVFGFLRGPRGVAGGHRGGA